MLGIEIRRSELPLVATLAGYYFLVVGSHYLIKPARNAYYLEHLGANLLPWVYIATGLATWWAIALYQRLTPGWPLSRAIAATLLVIVSSLLVFWWLLPAENRAVTFAFYLWGKVYGVLLPSQFWLLAEESLDTRQAKRLFGPVGAGGILGAVIGSGVASVLAGSQGTNVLLAVASMGLVGALALIWLASRDPAIERAEPRPVGGEPSSDAAAGLFHGVFDGASRKHGLHEGGKSPAESSRSLLRMIAALLVMTVLVHTIADWQFNKAAQEAFSDLDARTAFFGTFNAGINVFTLFVQLVATSWILRFLGIRFALLMLPVALGLGGIAVFLVPGLVTASVLRGADDSLRYSIDQSSRELLFLPVPAALRRRFKPWIDLIGHRVANALGGVIILVAITWLDRPLAELGILVVVLACAWVAVSLRARRQYAETLQRILTVQDIDVASLAQARLDADAKRAIREGLASDDPASVHVALGLAEHTDPKAFLDEFRDLLTRVEDPGLKRHLLQLLAAAGEREIVRRALAADRTDGQLTAEALAYACAAGEIDDLDDLEECLEGDDPLLATAAAVCLLEDGDPETRRAGIDVLQRAISWERDHAGVDVRVEAAKVIRESSSLDGLEEVLLDLLSDHDVNVVRAALTAAGSHPTTDLVATICRAGLRRTLRSPALRTLRSFGVTAAGPLTGLLADPRQPRQVRQLAARALGRIDHPTATEGLLAGVTAEDPAVRRSALKALNYVRRRGHPVDLQPEAEAAVIDIEWREFLSLHRLAGALDRSAGEARHSFVSEVLRERIDQAQERLFRALALRYPIRTLFFAYRGLGTKDPAARAHAVELIDSTVERPLRLPLVGILEAETATRRARIAAGELGVAPADRESALHELITPGDPWLAACALAALGPVDTVVAEGLRQELLATDYAPLLELLGQASPPT